MRDETPNGIVQIDEHHLDKECIRLPGDYLKYAQLAAEAKRDVDEAKAELEYVQANLSQQIRNTPGQFGLEKVTESAITGVIALQKPFLAAQTVLGERRHKYEMLQAVVWALDHKKRSLTLLVDLHGMGYFSSPKFSEAGKRAVDDMTKRAVRRPREQD